MDAKRSHFVRIAGEVRGPLAVEHLRSLAEAQLLQPGSEIAASADGPWVRLDALPLCAEVFPARPALNFRASEFEKVNDEAKPAIAVEEIKDAALHLSASLRGREVVVTPQTPRGTRADEPPNEVQQMVQDVGRRVAANAPAEILPPVPAPFPRWRWFLALGVLGTAGILSIPLYYPDRKSDEFTFSILAGWIVLYNGFLVLVMVMERGVRGRLRQRKLKLDFSRNE